MRRLSDRVASDTGLDPALVERVTNAVLKELFADLIMQHDLSRRAGDNPLYAAAYRELASEVFAEGLQPH